MDVGVCADNPGQTEDATVHGDSVVFAIAAAILLAGALVAALALRSDDTPGQATTAL